MKILGKLKFWALLYPMSVIRVTDIEVDILLPKVPLQDRQATFSIMSNLIGLSPARYYTAQESRIAITEPFMLS